MKVVWVSTWERVCGIADYSKELWPVIQKSLTERGDEGFLISLDQFKSEDAILEELKRLLPEVIHFQHEYGIFGGKNPPFYYFPNLIRRILSELPKSKIIATAHSVISDNYKFPLQGRGWEIPVRTLANIFLLKNLREYWGPRTWGRLHGTITHSKRQLETVRKSGAAYIEVVPHFVPVKEKPPIMTDKEIKTVLVFGFFTYEKGQDIVIEAFKYLKDLPHVHLVLAGGLRQKRDQNYFEDCKNKIKNLNLGNRVTITGYLENNELNKYFAKADLIIAPFRITSGSGSLAQALARGLPILASDLPLNLEISEREPGTLEYFESENPKELARRIRELIFDGRRLNLLRQGALRYAVSLSPARIAYQHLLVYDNLVK